MKPKGLAVVLLKNAKKAESDDSGGDEPKMPDGKEVAQELIDAIEAKDPEGVWKAFRGLSACAGDGEDGEYPDEEEAEGDDQE